jgi:hypothetical protein
LRAKGSGAVVAGGWCSHFIGAGGAPRRGGNGRLNGFNTIDGGEGLRGGLIGGFKAKEGKCLTGITRREIEQWGWPKVTSRGGGTTGSSDAGGRRRS